MQTSRTKLVIAAVALSLAGCAEPLQPAPTATGPTVAIYLIDFGDPAKALAYQNLFPLGVTGMSPEAAARTFTTPLGGQTPGRGFVPPGIYVVGPGPQFDTSIASGTIPTGYTSNGTTYPDNEFVWIGYFAR